MLYYDDRLRCDKCKREVEGVESGDRLRHVEDATPLCGSLAAPFLAGSEAYFYEQKRLAAEAREVAAIRAAQGVDRKNCQCVYCTGTSLSGQTCAQARNAETVRFAVEATERKIVEARKRRAITKALNFGRLYSRPLPVDASKRGMFQAIYDATFPEAAGYRRWCAVKRVAERLSGNSRAEFANPITPYLRGVLEGSVVRCSNTYSCANQTPKWEGKLPADWLDSRRGVICPECLKWRGFEDSVTRAVGARIKAERRERIYAAVEAVTFWTIVTLIGLVLAFGYVAVH